MEQKKKSAETYKTHFPCAGDAPPLPARSPADRIIRECVERKRKHDRRTPRPGPPDVQKQFGAARATFNGRPLSAASRYNNIGCLPRAPGRARGVSFFLPLNIIGSGRILESIACGPFEIGHINVRTEKSFGFCCDTTDC